MGIEWEPPRWRQQGRTGPGPGAPRYRKAKDRSKVRRESDGCCYAGQAVKAVWIGKFKLARRFARLDIKTRMGLI